MSAAICSWASARPSRQARPPICSTMVLSAVAAELEREQEVLLGFRQLTRERQAPPPVASRSSPVPRLEPSWAWNSMLVSHPGPGGAEELVESWFDVVTSADRSRR